MTFQVFDLWVALISGGALGALLRVALRESDKRFASKARSRRNSS